MALRSAAVSIAAGVMIALAAAPAFAGRVLLMHPDGTVSRYADRFLSVREVGPSGIRISRGQAPTGHSAAARSPKATRAALKRLLAISAIDQATYDRAVGDVDRAVELTHKLSGDRRAGVANVLADLEGMASRGAVIASRLPPLLATLEANIHWWTTGPLLGSGERVEFSGSQIVWQHYPGHGIQIQWLGTWGKAEGLFFAKDQDAALEDLVAESMALASDRAGGIAFEYMFPFDGGSPPWVSGLAQGAALSGLVRAGLRLKDGTWYAAARRAIGIFRTPPPEGVAQHTANGTHYLQYSFAPRLHIINGFIEALTGLFDYASVLDDPEGRALFAAGRTEAAAELPRYDTGGWSKYSEYRESDLHYHELLRTFLGTLCTRLRRHEVSDEPFCRYAARFTTDLSTPPVITFDRSQSTARVGHTAHVRFSIDKPATVTVVITRGAFTHRVVVSVASGAHSFGWHPPTSGNYTVRISARDLAGNTGSADSAKAVRPSR